MAISIKTITGNGGVKAAWTVDAEKAREFRNNYEPKANIILVNLRWNGIGKLYYIPLSTQQDIFSTMGPNSYFKLPKAGTNPRGVEFSQNAIQNLFSHSETKSIDVLWARTSIEYNTYARWVEYWEET